MEIFIDFNSFLTRTPDLRAMDEAALQDRLEQLRALIDQLDENEPDDMESEEYEEWGDLHEELEDLLDDVIDQLESRK